MRFNISDYTVRTSAGSLVQAFRIRWKDNGHMQGKVFKYCDKSKESQRAKAEDFRRQLIQEHMSRLLPINERPNEFVISWTEDGTRRFKRVTYTAKSYASQKAKIESFRAQLLSRLYDI